MTSLEHATNEDPHDDNFLAACLEDRLDGQEMERLIEHLTDCRECRGTLAALVRGADLLPRSASVGLASPERARRRLRPA